MREILYHGKRLDNGEWVEGYYLRHGDKAYICPEVYAFYRFDGGLCLGGFIEVDPDTVGRETGLTDRNGKRISEGDVVRFYDTHCPYLIKWNNSVPGFWLWRENHYHCLLLYAESMEVIGNIHDNPELLERGRE